MAHCYLAALPDAVGVGDVVAIDRDEARHAAQVARVRVGERLTFTDGEGTLCVAQVTEVDRQRVAGTVTEVVRYERPMPSVTLVQALAKGDRAELAIQAATELGVDRVIPWSASRSIARWDESKRDKGRDRWQVIVREAAKQSIRAWIPTVLPVHSTGELAALPSRLLALDPLGDVSIGDLALEPGADEDIALIVGPEGGITDAEFAILTAAGAQRVRLGDAVLRTSTAGPAAMSVLAFRLGRWARPA